MPAQRTHVPAYRASGHQSDAPVLPAYTRLLSVASTPSGPTLTGRQTTRPAEFGPAHRTPAPHTQSTAALCAQLDHLRTALASAGYLDAHLVNILTATIASLATVTTTIGHQQATVTITPAHGPTTRATAAEDPVPSGTVLLKALLRRRHWQSYHRFCREYDKAAATIDASLTGSYPSRAQHHRWLSGRLTSTPHPHHCEVLEAMFPGYTAAQLMAVTA